MKERWMPLQGFGLDLAFWMNWNTYNYLFCRYNTKAHKLIRKVF